MLLLTFSLTAKDGLGLLHLQSLLSLSFLLYFFLKVKLRTARLEYMWEYLRAIMSSGAVQMNLEVCRIYSLHFNTCSINVDNVHSLLCWWFRNSLCHAKSRESAHFNWHWNHWMQLDYLTQHWFSDVFGFQDVGDHIGPAEEWVPWLPNRPAKPSPLANISPVPPFYLLHPFGLKLKPCHSRPCS